MLNVIWGAMIVLSVIYAVFSGNMENLGNDMMTSAKEAVSLGISMLGVIMLWSGVMQIAKESGIIDYLSKVLEPFVGFLFPRVRKEKEIMENITVNIISNIFGLGAAATPAGLKAMRALEKFEENRIGSAKKIKYASNEMCAFLVLNISSLQLIPVNMIAFREQYGSANPMLIVAPGILATTISTIIAILFIKLMCFKSRKKPENLV